ncbi:dihydroorotase [Candidatus Woesearchaeota archaeon]|jgi:dihydroorotase|nr:dihydroorotase [Candidatus Woesearchaeota archaeon]|tara:strand:- start:28727 stop:29944 length:1218 start_codon:yes stop_codon:yes gene_type:complete
MAITPKMSLLIKNCRLSIKNKLYVKNILIRNGKISKITSKEPKADEIIDAKDNFVMPGLIDCHVHFREPGLTHKEDFLTGSMAAAKGGVTTVLDMPNTLPPTTTIEALEEKRKLAAKSIVNYGFNFGATTDNLSDLKKAKNIAAVKLYMDSTTGELKVDDYETIAEIFKISKITIIHAEDISVKTAIDIFVSNKIKNKLHVAHVSSEKELEYAKQNKIKKQVTAEVTPHHLFMNEKDLQSLGAFAEMKPRLKTEHDQKALWKGVHDGTVDLIATDHAPHLKEEKEKANYPFGVPGVETMLPLLLDAYNNKKIDLSTIMKLCCENPAEIFRIKNKGILKEGYDADLVIVDLEKRQAVRNQDLLTKCRWSPFEGKILKGWPITTIVNGNVVYDDGKINDVKARELKF